MSHWKVLSGAIAIATLSVASTALADSYYGPRQVGDQCYFRSGIGESMGYWGPCAARAANATIPRPGAAATSRNARTRTQTQNQSQSQPRTPSSGAE